MSNFFCYQILADTLVLNLKKWKKLKVPFFLLIFYYFDFAWHLGPHSHLNTTCDLANSIVLFAEIPYIVM